MRQRHLPKKGRSIFRKIVFKRRQTQGKYFETLPEAKTGLLTQGMKNGMGSHWSEKAHLNSEQEFRVSAQSRLLASRPTKVKEKLSHYPAYRSSVLNSPRTLWREGGPQRIWNAVTGLGIYRQQDGRNEIPCHAWFRVCQLADGRTSKKTAPMTHIYISCVMEQDQDNNG